MSIDASTKKKVTSSSTSDLACGSCGCIAHGMECDLGRNEEEIEMHGNCTLLHCGSDTQRFPIKRESHHSSFLATQTSKSRWVFILRMWKSSKSVGNDRFRSHGTPTILRWLDNGESCLLWDVDFWAFLLVSYLFSAEPLRTMPYELRNSRERKHSSRHPMISKAYYLPWGHCCWCWWE